jgi:putative membrane protein
MMWWNGNGGWMWFCGILTIIFWVVIILLVVWLVRRMSGPGMGMRHNADALSIAKERYAKGEISHEEFEKIKKNLS